MSYRFLAEARAEFDTAVDWYEARQAGLGQDFIDEVYATVRRAEATPQAYPRAPRAPHGREVRIGLVRRFDYLVFYEVTAAEIIIVDVSHAKRRRHPWRQRLSPPPAPPPTP